MDVKEIRKVAASYFGFTPSIKESKKIKVYRGSEIEGGVEERIKIRWEEHIGNLSGVARITPLDIMHMLGLERSEENYRRAVEMMKGLAKKHDLYLVEIEKEGRYLLVNPKYRR